jgi:Ethanolamine utilization protein EutJ (predicted chaperonin)
MQGKKKTGLPPGSMPAPDQHELVKKAISLGNDVGTSEVVIVCVDERRRDKLFNALVNIANENKV